VEKSSIGSEGNDEDIDKEKGEEAVYRGKKNQANSGQTRPDNNEPPGAEPIDQMSNDRALDSSFKASGAIEERNRRATHAKIALQGEEKNCEAVVDNTNAHGVD
jgi:hypothetical protein